MTIWKFPIAVTDEQVIRMPACADILTCQVQAGVLCIWAVVDPDAPYEARKILVFGTGHPLPALPIGAPDWMGTSPGYLEYIGTFQLQAGALVFHVFTERP